MLFNGAPSGATIWHNGQWSEPVFPDPKTGFSIFVTGLTNDARSLTVYDIHLQRFRSYLVRDGVRVSLGYPFGGRAIAVTISGDGSTVVGTLRQQPYARTPFMASDGVAVSFGEPGPRYINGAALYSSFDGRTVAGYSEALDVTNQNGDIGSRSWIWTDTSQFTLIPTLDDPSIHQIAGGISSNGRFVVGTDADRTGTPGNYRGWIWSVDGDLTEIDRPDGWSVFPSDVSADGAVVVGRLRGRPGVSAVRTSFIWTRDVGLVDVGPMIRDRLSSFPNDPLFDEINLLFMNDEGTRFVGTFSTGSEPTAVFFLNIPCLP